MSALLENILLWRLAIARIVLYSFFVGSGTYMTSMNGLEWSVLNGTQKVCLILGVCQQVAGVVIAFLDRTMARVTAGESPVGTEPEPEKIKLP